MDTGKVGLKYPAGGKDGQSIEIQGRSGSDKEKQQPHPGKPDVGQKTGEGLKTMSFSEANHDRGKYHAGHKDYQYSRSSY